MKKLALSFLFAAIAVFGVVQLATTPSEAGHCEVCCEIYFDECMETVGNEQMCTSLRETCIANC